VANLEARLKAEARIKAALDANTDALRRRREDFEQKQALNHHRNL
jgi:hypothetical protein